MPRPKFLYSEYFVPEVDNWHLTDDAPKELVEEFEAWMQEHEESFKDGEIID